jgi:hypothetical protein
MGIEAHERKAFCENKHNYCPSVNAMICLCLPNANRIEGEREGERDHACQLGYQSQETCD